MSAWRWVALLASAACASSPPAPTELDARFATPAAHHARGLALDLYARAQAARAQARDAARASARAEHAERAWLWLQAAIVEAERVEAERAVDAARSRARRASEAHAREVHALLAFEGALARTQAARAAADLAQRADRPHARGMPRAEHERLDAEVATHLQERSRLVLAAAIAMGADDSQQQPVREWLARSEAADDKPHARRAAAERALQAAEQVLEVTRAARRPSNEEQAPP